MNFDRLQFSRNLAGLAKLGKRDGLKHHCPKGLVGSNPTPGTNCRWSAQA
jgi:hypothetical protein